MDEARLRAWSPSMAEYHAGFEVSQGFLADYRHLGLSEAIHARTLPRSRMTTKTELACGTTLHAWLQEGVSWSPAGNWPPGRGSRWQRREGSSIRVAPPGVEARRGKEWAAALADARGADVLLLHKDFEACRASFDSLHRGDTGRKREILAMHFNWRRWAEVSWRWELEEVPGLICRIRQDLVCEAPSGAWYCPGIKTTSKPVNERHWWPFWRRYYREAEALYREGLRNLFDATPFRQVLIVARTVPPYKWTWWDLESKAQELADVWYSELVPDLREIKETMDRGEWYGPEERELIA